MGGPAPGTCPHGLTATTCLICETLTPSRRPEAAFAADPDRGSVRRRSRGLGSGLAVLAVVAVVGLLVVSWVAALAWALIRLVELVAVAVVSGWICWRLGVRHGRRHPG